VAKGSIVDVAKSSVAVAAREGVPKPDISTPDALKATLLAAKSVVYADPARGASSGIHVDSVLKRLGIYAEMAPKTVLRPGGYVVEAVAAGEAELGLHQVSEILPVHGVTLLGPLPAELQRITPYAAAVGRTEQPERAAAVLAFITGPDVHPILRAKGLEPAS
jgi:molybdate transport system substrate-binding protein